MTVRSTTTSTRSSSWGPARPRRTSRARCRASATNLTTGTIPFNELIATSAVKSIELNGFTLTDQVSPGVTTPTGIFLYGGVKTLSFNSIVAQLDTSVMTTPYQIVIGTSNTPLKVAPSIYVNNIQDLVFDSTSTTVPTAPVTSPTVQFMINGMHPELRHHLGHPGPDHGRFPVRVPGGRARPAGRPCRQRGRTTSTCTARPRTSPCRGPRSRSARRAAAWTTSTRRRSAALPTPLASTSRATSSKLTFKRGLGNPSGVYSAVTSSGQPLPATTYGYTQGSTGYPAAGELGGVVSAKHIHKLMVGPANAFAQTAQNPEFVQSASTDSPYYQATPGYRAHQRDHRDLGLDRQRHDQRARLRTPRSRRASTIPRMSPGCEGTRAASHIGKLRLNGGLVNSDISATFRPAQQPLQPADRHRRRRQDQGHGRRQRIRYRRHHRPGQHRRRRVRQAPQGSVAGGSVVAGCQLLVAS